MSKCICKGIEHILDHHKSARRKCGGTTCTMENEVVRVTLWQDSTFTTLSVSFRTLARLVRKLPFAQSDNSIWSRRVTSLTWKPSNYTPGPWTSISQLELMKIISMY